MSEKEDVEQRLKDVIINECNTHGCKDCWLKFPDGDCVATELNNRLIEIDILEVTGSRNGVELTPIGWNYEDSLFVTPDVFIKLFDKVEDFTNDE